jgi:hypothetical protein
MGVTSVLQGDEKDPPILGGRKLSGASHCLPLVGVVDLDDANDCAPGAESQQRGGFEGSVIPNGEYPHFDL